MIRVVLVMGVLCVTCSIGSMVCLKRVRGLSQILTNDGPLMFAAISKNVREMGRSSRPVLEVPSACMTGPRLSDQNVLRHISDVLTARNVSLLNGNLSDEL